MSELSVKEPMAVVPEWISESFDAYGKEFGNEQSLGLLKLRQLGVENFKRLGMPTTKSEEWKYTNLSTLSRGNFAALAPAKSAIVAGALDKYLLGDIAPLRLVFIDGVFSEELSSTKQLPTGVSLSSIQRLPSSETAALTTHLGSYAPAADSAFISLNSAFVREGSYLRIAKGTVVKEPIHLVNVASVGLKSSSLYPRALIVAEENSQVTVIENFVGLSKDAYFTNSVTELVAGERAVVDHYKLGFEGPQAVHIGALQIKAAAGSNVSTHTFTFGGKLVRNEISPLLDGEGIEATLNGLTVIDGEQHVDNHTVLDHAKPNCLSHELFKGIYSGKSAGVFNGTIIVRPDAQKTNAIQSNRSLLLSTEATIDSKPQLKIWADDVKCTHGATIGQLDDDALFYLRARGISKEDARNILVHAFAGEVLSGIKLTSLKAPLERWVTARLEGKF